jgi:alpha-1,2-mannosyltransferase
MAPARQGKGRRRWISFGCAVLLAYQMIFLFIITVNNYGLTDPKVGPSNIDFVSFYAAGTLAQAGEPQAVYDKARHYAAEKAVMPILSYKYFNYPPPFLLLCTALSWLPYTVAFVVFEGSTLALYLLTARFILNTRGRTVLVPLLAFPEVFWALLAGQNAFLTAGLFGAATLLVDRRPALSGLLFGALCYKPHFGLLVPVALAAGSRWRAFAAAFASAAGLCLLSLGAFGWNAWQAFFAAFADAPRLYEGYSVWYSITPFGAMRMLGASPAAACAVQAGFTLAAVGLVAYVWRRQRPLPLRAAVLASATLIAIPVAFFYDLMTTAVAGAWLIRAAGDRAMPRWEKIALAGLFVLPLGSRFLTLSLHLPIEPLAAMVLAFIAAMRACRAPAAPSRATTIQARSGIGNPPCEEDRT